MRWSATFTILLPYAIAAVRVMLLLPNRRPRFEFVDHVFAGIECSAAVRRGNDHRNGHIADSQIADPVPNADLACAEALARFIGDARKLRDGHLLVGFVR